MSKPTFTSLSDFPSMHHVECGDFSHTIHFTRLLDRVVSISVMGQGDYVACVNNPCYIPGSTAPGVAWDDTVTNDHCSNNLEDCLKVATAFAQTQTLSWNPDLERGTIALIQQNLAK